MPISRAIVAVIACMLLVPAASGCDTPQTAAILENGYPDSTRGAPVVYRAFWQAISFPTPIPPGAATDPQPTVAASPNTAYVIVARGWDGGADAPAAASLVVLQSRIGPEVHWNTTVRIIVDDSTFAGNCDAGSSLSQADADFITQRVFASELGGLRYDAATCTATDGP